MLARTADISLILVCAPRLVVLAGLLVLRSSAGEAWIETTER